MAQIKKEYFVKGVDNQKRPNIVFDLKRDDLSKLKALSPEDKAKIVSFLKECQKDIDYTIYLLQS